MSKDKKKDVRRMKKGSGKPGVRIRAVRRSKPDVQRLAQALIEIAMSQAEVVVDEPDVVAVVGGSGSGWMVVSCPAAGVRAATGSRGGELVGWATWR